MPAYFCFAINPLNALRIEIWTPDFQPVLSSWSFLHYSTMLIFVYSYRTCTLIGIITVIHVVPDKISRKKDSPSLPPFASKQNSALYHS